MMVDGDKGCWVGQADLLGARERGVHSMHVGLRLLQT